MPFSNIPPIDPTLTRDKVIDLLLASIALEEFGLANLINAEAEKIKSALGTLDGQTVKNPSVSDLEAIDRAVRRVLQDIIKKEMLLQFKLENVLEIPVATTTSTSTSTTTTTTSTTTTSTSTSTTTTSTSTTTTSTSTSTTSTSTTTTSTSTSTTTTSTSTTTTSTSTTTTTTSTTTTTTTSTTSTTTSTTRRTGCCITGSGSGTISTVTGGDPRFNGGTANIQDPRINCGCCALGCTDPDNIAYQAVLGNLQLRLTARLDTITVLCNATTTPRTMTITGTADVTLNNPPNDPIVGTAQFIYDFTDGGSGPNADTFSIQIFNATNSALNHNSGLISLNGNVIIGQCS